MLSLGCERLPTPLKKKKKKKKKSSGSLPAPRSGYATTITIFFAHLLILQYPDQKVCGLGEINSCKQIANCLE